MLYQSSIGRPFRLLACIVLLAGGLSSPLRAAPAPTAPATSSGTYTVSYQSCLDCFADWLEERFVPGGSWYSIGQGTASFTAKASGSYEYRAAYFYLDASYNSFVSYSPVATVVVGSGSFSQRPPLPEQLRFVYRARSGDIDGDGRRDIYIARDGAGTALDGTLRRVILRGLGNGRFSPVAPSAGQSAVATGWPTLALDIELRDVNIDGFADLLLHDLARAPGFGGALDQIIFAPAAAGRELPSSVRTVDAPLAAFSDDLASYLLEPDYFATHATVGYRLEYLSYNYCDYQYAFGSDIYGYSAWPCYYSFEPIWVPFIDYSSFDARAVNVWLEERGIESGQVAPNTGFDRISSQLEGVLDILIGGWNIGEILGPSGGGLDSATRRGTELFAAMAGIAAAHADESDSGTDDRVLLRGRRVIGSGPFHTALQYGQSTISAYDDDPRALFDGTLVSQVDWPNDHPALTMQLGAVDAADAPAAYWSRLLIADSRYDDDLKYDLFPSIGQGGYNSNSYVSGIVQATAGIPTIPMSRFVGGERPVPASEFN